MGIPGKSHAKVKPNVVGIRYDTSVQGVPPPVIFGHTRASIKMIWGGNFKSHKGSGKKGGSKKGGSNTYTANYDWLLGYAPVIWTGTVWRNKDTQWYATRASQVFTTGTTFTITDPGFLGVVSVLFTKTRSFTFNDYGSPGAVTLSGTTQQPLYPAGLATAGGNIAPGGFNWADSVAETFSVGNWPGLTNGNRITTSVTASGAHPVTINYMTASKSPIASAGLALEHELGSGNEFSFPGGSAQQNIYPEFSGIAGANVDLGTGDTAPNDNFEVLSLYAYMVDGDANPADVILDILLIANPIKLNGDTSLAWNWNHGVGFSPFATPQGTVGLPNILADPP